MSRVSRGRILRALALALFLVVSGGSTAHPALAAVQGNGGAVQATDGSPNQGSLNQGDFRNKIFLAYSLAFGFMVLYLYVSYRKNSRLREDVEFLQQRIEELRRKAHGEPSTSDEK